MKHRWLFFLTLPTLALGSACTAPPDQSIIVTVARAPGDKCDFSDPTKYVEGGAVDLGALGAFSSYSQIFGWENDLNATGVTVNGQTLTTGTPNTFVSTSVKLSYVVVGGGLPTPPPGVVNMSATIAPGGTPTTNTVGVELLTQQAAQAICGTPNALTPYDCPNFTPNHATVTLLVTFQITGALVGGSAAQTNPITYPITLANYGHVNPATGLCANPCPAAPPLPAPPPYCYVPQVTSCGIPGRDVPYCVIGNQ
jgi:hypothetical protein